MSEISDELLMQYADGVLDDAGRAEVEAYLAADPNGVVRLAAFTVTGRVLARTLTSAMSKPMPQRLIDTVMTAPIGECTVPDHMSVERPPADIIDLRTARAKVTPAATPRWMMAAACLTLLATGAGSYWSYSRQSPDANLADAGSLGIVTASGGERIAGPALARELDTAASGQRSATELDGRAGRIKLVYTFQTHAGQICRQYDIDTAGKTANVGGTAPPLAATGVACRVEGGQWSIAGQAARTGSGAATPDKDGFIPAAGNKAPPQIEAIVENTIAGDVLGPEAEAALIASGWRASAAPHGAPPP